MYSGLPVVDIAEWAATAAVAKDRLRYRPFVMAVEKYVAEHADDERDALIVGGKTATALLLGGGALKSSEEGPPHEGAVELYSSRPQDHGRRIADIMYRIAPDGLAHYTRLDTFGADAVVVVDGREMARIRSLPQHGSTRLTDMVIPTMRPAAFVKATLPCMGPEIQLIDIYRSLCDPARAGDWPELLSTERRLRTMILGEMSNKIREATTGGAEVAEGGASSSHAASNRARFWHDLFHEFVLDASSNSDAARIVVGDAAKRPADISRGDVGNRLQMVTARRLEDEGEALRQLASRHSLAIITAINNPKVPIDASLRRLTAHFVAADGRREPFIDVFDAGRRELVPFVVDQPRSNARTPGAVPVGTLLVIMRFRLVDLWTMQLLHHIGAVNAGYARATLTETLKRYRETAAELDKLLAGPSGTALAKLFPFLEPRVSAASIGSWSDPVVAQKRRDFAAGKSKPFTPPYYPAARHGDRHRGGDASGDPGVSSPDDQIALDAAIAAGTSNQECADLYSTEFPEK